MMKGTAFAIACLMVGAGLFIFGPVQEETSAHVNSPPGAPDVNMPYDIVVSNIFATQFTVSWITSGTTARTGYVKIAGVDHYDERGVDGTYTSLVHYVIVGNDIPAATGDTPLALTTAYAFTIVSGGTEYGDDGTSSVAPALYGVNAVISPVAGVATWSVTTLDGGWLPNSGDQWNIIFHDNTDATGIAGVGQMIGYFSVDTHDAVICNVVSSLNTVWTGNGWVKSTDSGNFWDVTKHPMIPPATEYRPDGAVGDNVAFRVVGGEYDAANVETGSIPGEAPDPASIIYPFDWLADWNTTLLCPTPFAGGSFNTLGSEPRLWDFEWPGAPGGVTINLRNTDGLQIITIPTDIGAIGTIDTAIKMAKDIEFHTDMQVLYISDYQSGWKDFLHRNSTGVELTDFAFTSFTLEVGVGYVVPLRDPGAAANFAWATNYTTPTAEATLILDAGWNNAGVMATNIGGANYQLAHTDIYGHGSIDGAASWTSAGWQSSATGDWDVQKQMADRAWDAGTTIDDFSDDQNAHGFFVRCSAGYTWDQNL